MGPASQEESDGEDDGFASSNVVYKIGVSLE